MASLVDQKLIQQKLPTRSSAFSNSQPRPWMRMCWEELLFMHWPVPVESLQRLMPSGLSVETYDQQAWVGIVPFRMQGVGFRSLPKLPFASSFPELNVRTYVTDGKRSGVWFFSLDATSRLAVWGGRSLYRLAYQKANIQISRDGPWIRYRSARSGRKESPIRLDVEYRPLGQPYSAADRSLEHFLTARTCLFAALGCGNLYRANIHHADWRLQQAQAIIHHNSMARPLDLDLPLTCPHLHFARHTRVLVWPLERV